MQGREGARVSYGVDFGRFGEVDTGRSKIGCEGCRGVLRASFVRCWRKKERAQRRWRMIVSVSVSASFD